MDRAEQVFALQKTRFEQVAEEYTLATRKHMLDEQSQFQQILENLRRDSSFQSQTQMQRLRNTLEDEMNAYLKQQLAAQKQNFVDEQFMQRSALVAEAREEFAVCKSINESLKSECSQFMQQLESKAANNTSEAVVVNSLRQECLSMRNEYLSTMTDVKTEMALVESKAQWVNEESRLLRTSIAQASSSSSSGTDYKQEAMVYMDELRTSLTEEIRQVQTSITNLADDVRTESRLHNEKQSPSKQTFSNCKIK